MLQINGLREGLELFKTLGSDVRMQIVSLLAERGEMNLNEIAAALNLTNGALTMHIRKLQECGIIQISQEHSGRGNQKRCTLCNEQILLNVKPVMETREFGTYETEIPIGHYSSHSIQSPCGIAAAEGIVGKTDDTRYFSHSDRLSAELLWMQDGFVEYRIPCLIPEGESVTELLFSFEISSAFYGSGGGRQALIEFYLNDGKLGEWVTNEEIDGTVGIFTPEWWSEPGMRHGFLKMIVVNQDGVFLDGLKISDRALSEWQIGGQEDIVLRFRVNRTREYQGGLALYGAGFGNYQQAIHVVMHHTITDTGR